MGAMIDRFLCRVGRHDWRYVQTEPPPPGKNWLMYAWRACRRCYQMELMSDD